MADKKPRRFTIEPDELVGPIAYNGREGTFTIELRESRWPAADKVVRVELHECFLENMAGLLGAVFSENQEHIDREQRWLDRVRAQAREAISH